MSKSICPNRYATLAVTIRANSDRRAVMRRHLVLIGGLCGGLCLGALAGAQPTNAQFNLSPGGIFHALTRPLGAIFGNGPRMRARPYHYESRARPRLAAPVTAAVTPADA